MTVMQTGRVITRRGVPLRALRECGAFEGVSPAVLRQIADISSIKRYDRDEFLFHEGAPVRGLYLVRRGAVKVHRVNTSGKEQVLHIYRPGESLGEESLFTEMGHPADGCATEACEVILVQRQGLLEIVRREPDLALGLLGSMNRQLHVLVGLLDDLTLKDVKTRLANWLIQQCPDPASRSPIRIQLPTTKRILAAELGTVSETLSRTVAKFRDLNLLAVDGNTVTLFSPWKLTQLFPQTATASASGHLTLWSTNASAGMLQPAL